MTLLPHHREHLHLSALSDATIDRLGFYSETTPAAVAHLLNWSRPADALGPCLVIPYLRLDGTPNGRARLRPDRPRTANGKPVKYEAARGVSPIPYFTPGALAAIRTPGAAILVCEGEKKAAAADQSGCPTIGVAGVWNWQKPRGRGDDGKAKGERKLVADLESIDWRNRPVVVCFDTDETRNPSVAHARSELARVLTEHGARVVFVDLPHGPRNADGLPGKMGADDFIFAHGAEAFRELVDRALAGDPEPRNLDDWRAEMQRSRIESIDFPGVYYDTSPAGAGKSFADMAAAARAGHSLIVVPTHHNCREVAEQFQRGGLLAEAYPELSGKTCQNYETAARAIESGLAASAAVCPGCIFRQGCDYQADLADADAAAHRIATHQRAVFALPGLATGRRYIAIHEDAISVIRPTAESASTLGFSAVLRVADEAGQSAAVRTRDTQRYFFWRLGEVAKEIGERLRDTTDTAPIDLPAPVPPPRGTDAALFSAMQSADVWPLAECMRIARAAAAGELAELACRVDRIFRPGGKTDTKRAVVGVWHRALPTDAATWFSDSTASPDEILAVVPGAVDATPGGRLEQRHPAVQVPLDVKKSTARGRMLAVVRGLLEAFPKFQRIGVIIDKRHAPAVQGTACKGENLEKCYRQRIAKVEHFRSGHSRGSNGWLDAEVDALFVVGTPRVTESAVRSRLIRLGNYLAAKRDGRWEADYWSGIDDSGRRHTIRGSAYRDHDWHAAHRAVVRAELLQSVGRSRGILREGLPVVVASNESLGLPLATIYVQPLTRTESQALAAVRELSDQNSKGVGGGDGSDQNSKRYILEFRSVSTAAVASRLDKGERPVRRILGDLADRGLIQRITQRGGWMIPTAPRSGLSGPAATPEPDDDGDGFGWLATIGDALAGCGENRKGG